MRKILTFTMNDTGEFINKIRAIKGLRALSYTSLKEANEFVERVQAEGTVTETVDVSGIPAQEGDAIAIMMSGGINVLDVNANARQDILADIQSTACTAVAMGQYDIAKKLIAILETPF